MMEVAGPETMRVALAQINPTVGDLEGNSRLIADGLALADKSGAVIAAFPELALTGYPPEDLLLKTAFLDDARSALLRLTGAAPNMVAVIGLPWIEDGQLFNTAAIVYGGQIIDVVYKHHLPTYGVFDEDRYFARGQETVRFLWGDVRFGVTICEDIWYPAGPASSLGVAGIDVMLNINGSPFHRGKWSQRQSMLQTRAQDTGCYLVYVNMIGGQDELVFDGNSLVVDPDGRVVARAASFAEDLIMVDLPVEKVLSSWLHDPRRRWLARESGIATLPVRDHVIEPRRPAHLGAEIPEVQSSRREPLSGAAETYTALVTGTRDYVHKAGFSTVLIGLSGGIDSSLTACIAADALGAESVTGIAMPSRYSSSHSIEDARQLADSLGIHFETVEIDSVHAEYRNALAPFGQPEEPDVADENVQARIRGNILMTYSNRFGPMVLTTGNKSEMACGYATLYGDMAGGFAVLKDVPKLLVYELSRYRNSIEPVIPERVLTKAPSAELRPNQQDTDTLPPFEILDPILERYVERDESVDQIVAAGFDRDTVARVIRMVDRAEYKRRQAPPGVKLSPRAFGRDRRLPIVNHYHE